MGNDTVVAITKNQLVTLNRDINNFLHLQKVIPVLERTISLDDSIKNRLNAIIYEKDNIIQLQDKKVSTQNQRIDYLQKSLSASLKKEEKLRRQKNWLVGGVVGGTVAGLLIGVFMK